MGLLGNLTGKVLQTVAQTTSENKQNTVEAMENTVVSVCESLRPLIRSILMKNEVTDKDRQILARKAVGLGLDADEVSIQFDSLEASKKKHGKKSLFGKPNYEDYFILDFDGDFDDVFLTYEEQRVKEKQSRKDMDDEMASFGNEIGLLSKLGGL